MMWLWIGVLALAFVLLHLGRFWLNVRAGQALRQSTQPYEQHPVEPETRLLITGDSVAFGVGAQTSALSVAGLIGQAHPSIDITNVGVSGAQADGLAAQFSKVSDQHFDATIIIVGANDVIHWANLKDSANHLDQAIQAAKKLSPVVIVMPEGNIGNAPIFPTWFAALLTKRSRELRQEYVAVATKREAIFVDVFEERGASTWRKDVDHYYAADKFHPGTGGNADWATTLQQALTTAGRLMP